MATAWAAAGSVVTAVPGSAQPSWLTAVNDERAAAALPALTENAVMDAGDLAHATYLVLNNAQGHTETPGLLGYSDAGLTAAQASDVMESNSTATSDVDAITKWMTGPFHSVGILDPNLAETGFGSYRQVKSGQQMAAALNIITGVGRSPRASLPVAWPGNGAGVPYTKYDGGESPDPLSQCPGYSVPTGLPIMYLNGDWASVSVSGYSVSSGGQALETCELDGGNYRNTDGATQSSGRNVLAARGAVVLIPRHPLSAGARYDVSLTVNGATRAWSFTAGVGASPATPLAGAAAAVAGPSAPAAPRPASHPSAPRTYTPAAATATVVDVSAAAPTTETAPAEAAADETALTPRLERELNGPDVPMATTDALARSISAQAAAPLILNPAPLAGLLLVAAVLAMTARVTRRV